VKRNHIAIGYHGCDREIGERVLAGEIELRPSTNDYDWLGSGVYLWENDEVRAWQWAKSLQRHAKMSVGQIKEPFVVGVVVDLGDCLDLLQADSIRLVAEAHADLRQVTSEASRSMPRNIRIKDEIALRRLDCAVIQHLHRRREEDRLSSFDTVRAAFPEGHELYPDAGFQERTHIQVCVRNTRQIVGCFRVKGRRA